MADDYRENVGNEKRARWRSICRKRLAEHICETLGINIKPSDVRLKLSERDRMYKWKLEDPHLGPLFEKHLSKHSVGAYIQLCQEIGSGFRAIHAEPEGFDPTHGPISRLQDDKTRMAERLELAEAMCLHQQQIISTAELKSQEQDLIIQEAHQKIQLQEAQIEQWVMYSEILQSRCSQGSECLLQAIQLLHGYSLGDLSDT